MSQLPSNTSSASSSQRTASFRERLGSLITNSYHLTSSQVQAVVEQAVSGVRNFVRPANAASTRRVLADRDEVSERDVIYRHDVRDVGNILDNSNIQGPSHNFQGESYRRDYVPPPHVNVYSSSSDEESVPHSPPSVQTGGGLKRKSKSKAGKGVKKKQVHCKHRLWRGQCKKRTD